jgi:hypothetical protein
MYLYFVNLQYSLNETLIYRPLDTRDVNQFLRSEIARHKVQE